MAIDHEELLSRSRQLESLAESLKAEFVGIDGVIDRVTQVLSAWHRFPAGQRRPTIICLWGMTGSGKTTLVRAIADKLGVPMMEADVGALISDSWSFSHMMNDKFSTLSGRQCIVLLDDLHSARTIDENGAEVDRASTRGLWSMLSDGMLKVESWRYGFDCFRKLHQVLSARGKASPSDLAECRYDYIDVAREEVSDYDEEDVKAWTIFRSDIETIAYELDETTEWAEEVIQKLQEDYVSTVRWLIRELKRDDRQIALDFRQACIFVAGNLDEVYTSAGDMNPDITADELHEWSETITVPMIKNALMRRFRAEQVSRLGSNHVIYPAFRDRDFRRLITMELDKVAAFIREVTEGQVRLRFGDSVVDKIYDEGVFPTQGTRCVLSTVAALVEPAASKFVSDFLLAKTEGERHYNVECSDGKLHFRDSGLDFSFKIFEDLGKLRLPKVDDRHVQVAIHEAGHVAGMLNGGIVPVKVTAHTADPGSMGFVELGWNTIDGVHTRADLRTRMEGLLGGWAAESILLGEELVGNGAESDLRHVTLLATGWVCRQGLGSKSHYALSLLNGMTHNEFMLRSDEDNDEIMSILDAARERIQMVIAQNQRFVLALARRLLETSEVRGDEIIALAKEFDLEIPDRPSVTDRFCERLEEYKMRRPD